LKRASSKKRKPKARKPRNPERLERGVVHEIIQPVKVYVWMCPREKCPKNAWADRFQATVEAFLDVQVNSHVRMHEREDNAQKNLEAMRAKAQTFR
jgi:hypothetical protein